ncbi:MAG TPA: acyl-CoA dehydrogenase family protein [Polyangiaceae bacterium]|jgi:alkylation response protein AidB-like acyl-CoA dehydrogenase|nr:acyl-CoA dehydrogenase family protein [Polyangiaceae bacterium]
MTNGFATTDRDDARAALADRGDPFSIARTVAETLATSAAARDQLGGTPKAERDLLRRSGLLHLVIPKELGGWGASWADTMRIVRILARADSAVAHVFGFHHLLLATVRLFGRKEQWVELWAATAESNWFWGNALNPLDTRTTIAACHHDREAPKESGTGGTWVVNGTKSFCSGARDSDRLIVSALPAAGGRLVVAAIPTSRDGIHLRDDWDNMGQRQTDSGSVDFIDVAVAEHEILDTPGPLGSTFASLRPCIAQLVLANVYLGIAEGAVAEARRYTRAHSRPWSGSGVSQSTEDPFILLRYGKLGVELQGAELLTERAATLLDEAWNQGDNLTARARGECSLAIAAAKVSTSEAGLEITTRMFDVMGARATGGAARLDRFWRNVRTHTLHDPVDYKLRDIGNFLLNDQLPVPSFYS